MSKARKIKALRQDIRNRWNSPEKSRVADEFKRAMESNDKKLKRLYFTALDPLLYDEANKENLS